MKKSAVAAALAAAVVAIPVAAEAATYYPISFNSPRDSVRSYSGQRISMPSIDVTGISGHRYTGNFALKVYFKDLAQTRYARRFVVLSDITSRHGYSKNTLVESRIGSNPARPVADVIVLYTYDDGRIKAAYKRCPDVRGSVDYRGNAITYTVPTECFVNNERDQAGLFALTALYHRATWRDRPASSPLPHPDAADDSSSYLWDWTYGNSFPVSRAEGAGADPATSHAEATRVEHALQTLLGT